ncbi:hypothetical protein ACJJTC_007618 [Scirpophaga incertulas]
MYGAITVCRAHEASAAAGAASRRRRRRRVNARANARRPAGTSYLSACTRGTLTTPHFHDKYDKITRATTIELNSLRLVVSVDSWVTVLDFFGVAGEPPDEPPRRPPNPAPAPAPPGIFVLATFFTRARARRAALRAAGRPGAPHRALAPPAAHALRPRAAPALLQVFSSSLLSSRAHVRAELRSVRLADLARRTAHWRHLLRTRCDRALRLHYSRYFRPRYFLHARTCAPSCAPCGWPTWRAAPRTGATCCARAATARCACTTPGIFVLATFFTRARARRAALRAAGRPGAPHRALAPPAAHALRPRAAPALLQVFSSSLLSSRAHVRAELRSVRLADLARRTAHWRHLLRTRCDRALRLHYSRYFRPRYFLHARTCAPSCAPCGWPTWRAAPRTGATCCARAATARCACTTPGLFYDLKNKHFVYACARSDATDAELQISCGAASAVYRRALHLALHELFGEFRMLRAVLLRARRKVALGGGAEGASGGGDAGDGGHVRLVLDVGPAEVVVPAAPRAPHALRLRLAALHVDTHFSTHGTHAT